MIDANMHSKLPRSDGSARATARTAADYLPERLTLKNLRIAADTCKGCDLYKRATQTVFGEGRSDAELLLVGEVPGDKEDLEGRPFVGPAGKLLDVALHAAGLDRKEVYVTNAVKHFKWEPRGVRRLHAKPGTREINACRPWLEAEIEVVSPRTIVLLGATAAQSLLGSTFRLTKHLGECLTAPFAERVFATYHPSAILRAPDHAQRERMTKLFIRHLQLAAS
jgi:uracil-DNA glycosylase